MKFSWALIQKLYSEATGGKKLPAGKNDIVERINAYFFEAIDSEGDIIDIDIPPNRFSDAASHWGIAKEIAAIYGVKFKEPQIKPIKSSIKQRIKVSINEPKLCSRATAGYFEDVKIGPSPKWMQDVLKSCDMRPINNLVDITNYVMLETGQPLHAFDFDKMDGGQLMVRRAKPGEKLETLDGKMFKLDKDVLVLADKKDALDIAGIKGGKKAEILPNTKNILLTACNFDHVSIYKTSRKINLATDASKRFAHGLNPQSALWGLSRGAGLIYELCGAEAGGVVDINFVKPSKKIIKFDIDKFNKFIGVNLDFKTIRKYLTLIGCRIKTSINQLTNYPINQFLVEAPLIRQDIEIFEDLAEEVARLYGYNRIKSLPPHVPLIPSGFEDSIVLQDKIRKILIGMGIDETQNYALIAKDEGEKFAFGGELVNLKNPISQSFYYLRPSLVNGFLKNITHNFKFLDEFRLFEIGKTFAAEDINKITERLVLGIVVAGKKNSKTFFELKGITKKIFEKVGLVDYLIAEPGGGKKDWVRHFTKNYLRPGEAVKIESGKEAFGYLGRISRHLLEKGEASILEIDLDVLLKLVEEEHEYRPLPKYPSVMRDISIIVDGSVKIGGIMRVIQEADEKYIDDVDIIDEYEAASLGANKKSLSFRIIFQAEDRTLTSEEVDKIMEKVVRALQFRFKAKIR